MLMEVCHWGWGSEISKDFCPSELALCVLFVCGLRWELSAAGLAPVTLTCHHAPCYEGDGLFSPGTVSPKETPSSSRRLLGDDDLSQQWESN